jgi:hypothetical protein
MSESPNRIAVKALLIFPSESRGELANPMPAAHFDSIGSGNESLLSATLFFRVFGSFSMTDASRTLPELAQAAPKELI